MAIGNPITLTNNIADKTTSVTATADQTLFTVPGGYLVNKLGVFRNGVRLSQSEDYTANDGATITLVTPANLSDTLTFQTFDYFDVADAIGAGGGDITGSLTVSGTITGGAFSGDGSGLTGVASTDYIITGTAATFTGGINAAQSDVSVRNLTGVAATFTGVLTYEDVTNIDSVGIVTARQGIRVPGGTGTSNRIELGDSQELSLQYNTSDAAAIISSGGNPTDIKGTAIRLKSNADENMLIASNNGAVSIYHDNALKLETTSTGLVATGIVTATSFSGDGSSLTNLNIPAAFNELDSALFN